MAPYRMQQRKPWPMGWIVLAVILFIGPYTYLTLRYRKASSFQPYEDARERKHVAQAGYSRVSLSVGRLPEGAAVSPLSAAVAPEPGGLPADLAASLVEPPVLAETIDRVSAPPTADARDPYPLVFDCTLAGAPDQWTTGAAHLYRKTGRLFIVVGFAKLADGLAQRLPETRLRINVPFDAIDPGAYRVVLVGARMSRAWTVQVH